MPHRLAGEDVVSWNRNGDYSEQQRNAKRFRSSRWGMQKGPTLMLDPVKFFLIQSLRSNWLVMSFPDEIMAQGVEFDCEIIDPRLNTGTMNVHNFFAPQFCSEQNLQLGGFQLLAPRMKISPCPPHMPGEAPTQ